MTRWANFKENYLPEHELQLSVCFGVKCFMLDVLIVLTRMWSKVPVSLIKKKFLFTQEKFHASKGFIKIYPLKMDFKETA